MPASRSSPVETSYTKRAFDFLVNHDDFVTMPDIATCTGLTIRQLRQTLPWLRKCKAIDSVESDGRLFWYATPESDLRLRTLDEHRREDEPRNVRGGGRRTKSGTARMNELSGSAGFVKIGA